jgi:hypothetical protein
MELKDEQTILEKGIEHLFHIEFSSEDGLVIDHLSAPQNNTCRSEESSVQESNRNGTELSSRSTKSDQKRSNKRGNIS